MASPKAGSFSAYLEYAQRGTSDRPETQQPAGPMRLIVLLATAPAGLPMETVAKASGMDASEFRGALKKFVDLGYIEIQGPALDETVCITARGAEIVKML